MQQASYEGPLMMLDTHYRQLYTVALPFVAVRGFKDHHNQPALTATVNVKKIFVQILQNQGLRAAKTHHREEGYKSWVYILYYVCNAIARVVVINAERLGPMETWTHQCSLSPCRRWSSSRSPCPLYHSDSCMCRRS